MSEHHLSNYPVQIAIRIAWGDMDALRHVNNAMYFRYFESSRLAYMEALEHWHLLRDAGMMPVLASTSARYKLPLTYPDTIEVGARVGKVHADRFEMEHAIYSHAHGRIATLGQALVVTVGAGDGRKRPMPATLRDSLRAP